MKRKIIIFSVAAMLLSGIGFEAKAIAPPLKKSVSAAKVYSFADLKKNLEYDFGKAIVRNNYDDRLDQLAKLIISKKCAVALRGHADSIGTYKGNWMLSEKRADAVKAYLVKKGVDGNKVIVTPFGSTIPIASNKTAEGRQKNRRVEIILNNVTNI